MVAWTDAALAALAYASTIVATLRAGSRAIYLLQHDQIGVMDGPLILGPNDVGDGNETQVSPLWELSFGFQQAVRLAVTPASTEHQVLVAHQNQEDNMSIPEETYSMSACPVQKFTSNSAGLVRLKYDGGTGDENDSLDRQIDRIIEENSWSYKLKALCTRLPAIPGLYGNLTSAKKYLSKWTSFVWMRTGNVDDCSDDESEWNDEEGEGWDFKSWLTTDVPLSNSSTTPQREIHATAYAPQSFADLRERFGISEDDFRESLLESGPFVSFQSNSKGAARVGGVFFFTRDGTYMIKTIKREEASTLLAMLPKYHKYMCRYGRRTLLTRFCGMYGVSVSDSSESRPRRQKSEEKVFVVMNSVFPAESPFFISERFDLKGSTVGRECSVEEKERKGTGAILKDLDIKREVDLVRSLQTSPSGQPKYGFHIGAPFKSALLTQLRRDVRLLVQCGVMDYSLLVGIVDMDRHRMDEEAIRALDLSEEQEFLMRIDQRKIGMRPWERALLSALAAPIRIMSAPPVYFARKVWSTAENYVSSILTLPLPYYGAGICGVDGGDLSLIHGSRTGHRAIYYIGLIDFLQPWTTRKVIERRLKGMVGNNVRAISCVPPDEYAVRFLQFIDAHVS